MIGQRLSHYRIVEKIGAGGMGEVYRARDEHLDRDVAIKVLPKGTLADEKARKRFRKEALALSKLSHPSIATVFDFDTQEGVDFLVMEYVEGTSLAERVKSGALAEKEVISLGAQIAEAMEEAHEHGVVHRDLKPGNIAVTPKGRVKVLDFGLARLVRPVSDEATTAAMTEEMAVAGTLAYMSPEELRGERADHRSDLYSFGVVLYEIASGRRPFEEKLATALINAIINKPPEPPSTHNRQVSPDLENIINRALYKDPEHRYQSAREMKVDLERLSAPTHLAAPTRQKVGRNWVWAVAGVAAILVVLAGLNVGGLRKRLLTEPFDTPIESIAVLPLVNLSGDPEQEYFADGMTEALIADLAKISALRVISRQSIMRFKDTKTPLPEIADALNVDALVEGSVLRSGDRVRITTQLIQATPEKHLWADSYERSLKDILSLQSEVARRIAQEIRVTVTAKERVRLGSIRPVDPEVHEAYLKGRHFWNINTRDALRRSIEHFQKAIELDANYALAHAGLADAYLVLAHRGEPPGETLPKAKAAAIRALEIDDELAEAHTALADSIFHYDWDWERAENGFHRAIELNPSYATAHNWYSVFLAAMGRVDEAISEMKSAQELTPLQPNAMFNLSGIYLRARRFDDALQAARTTLELYPVFARARVRLGKIHTERGEYELAISELGAALARSPEGVRERMELARAFAKARQSRKANALLIELEELSQREYIQPHFFSPGSGLRWEKTTKRSCG